MKRGTPDHPKTLRLMEELQCSKIEAVGLLEMLWQFTARFAPRGDIGRWTDESIAKGVEWMRGDVELVRALVKSGFLDSDKKHRLLVHDWSTHCDQGVRKFISRSKLTFATMSGRCPDGVRTKSKSVRTRDEPPFPIPIPVPFPIPVPVPTEQPGADAPAGVSLVVVPPVERVFGYWKTTLRHEKAHLTKERKEAIEKRLKEGYTVEDLCSAVDGCRSSRFHQGKNEREAVYDDIELICRSGTHVEKFVGLLRAPPKQKSLAEDPDVQAFLQAAKGGEA